MKQKIHNIALEAGGSHYPDVNSDTLQRFADLLIEECIRVVENTPTTCAHTTHDLGAVKCTIGKSVDALKEYFK
jgi:hypothetical protein